MRALQKVLFLLTVIFFVISILTDGSSARKPRRSGNRRGDSERTRGNDGDELKQQNADSNHELIQKGEHDTEFIGLNKTTRVSSSSSNHNANNNNKKQRQVNAYTGSRRYSGKLINRNRHEYDGEKESHNEDDADDIHVGMGDNRNATTTTRDSLSPELQQYRNRQKEYWLEKIRRKILDTLNLTEKPPIPNNEFTQHMKHEINNEIIWPNSFIVGQPDVTKIFQALQPSCKPPHKSDKSWYDPAKFRLYFEIGKKVLQDDDKNTTISSATLRIFKHPLETCNCNKEPQYPRGKRSRSQYKQQRHKHHFIDAEDNTLRITVYQYYKPIKGGRNEDKKKIVSTAVITKDYNGWVKLDLKEAFVSWLEKPKKNFGISIVTEDSAGKVIHPDKVFSRWNCSEATISPFRIIPVSLALLDGHSQNASHLAGYNSSLPSLDILSTGPTPKKVSPAVTRQKRYSGGKKNGGWKKPSCSIQETYVTVEELKWTDWIIQPRGFKYTTCKGTCSRLPRERYFKRKVAPSSRSNFKPVDHACCGPTKLKPLQMIHFNEKQTIMLSIFDDFIISECGCRP